MSHPLQSLPQWHQYHVYLSQSLAHIDTLPQGDFDEIIEKYVEMNIAITGFSDAL
jgi:hypothetical protein